MIEKIFKKIPRDYKKYFRADSAYGTKAIYNALLVNNVNFARCLGELAWSALLDKYEFKMGFKKTRLRFFDSKKCSIGSCLYPMKGLYDRSFLRVVFIRAKKKKIKKEDKRYYRYYAIVTNISEREMNDEEIIRFYRKRGNVENHIKDLKNGMDFKHFPCQSMIANRSWGMMGIYAYNLMRYAAYILYPKTGCFLKRVRYKMIFLASEIRRGQRKIRLRFSDYVFKEVMHLWISIHRHFCPKVSDRLRSRGNSPPL